MNTTWARLREYGDGLHPFAQTEPLGTWRE